MNSTDQASREALLAKRDEIRAMKRLDVCTAYFRSEYGGTVDDAAIAEVVNELSIPEINAIVGSVIDEPHLIER